MWTMACKRAKRKHWRVHDWPCLCTSTPMDPSSIFQLGYYISRERVWHYYMKTLLLVSTQFVTHKRMPTWVMLEASCRPHTAEKWSSSDTTVSYGMKASREGVLTCTPMSKSLDNNPQVGNRVPSRNQNHILPKSMHVGLQYWMKECSTKLSYFVIAWLRPSALILTTSMSAVGIPKLFCSMSEFGVLLQMVQA